MCGIAGALFRRPTTAADSAVVAAMADAIAHRGPDAFAIECSGRAVLASRRLSIVDVAHGGQPFTGCRGDVKVVYNGEIYNYKALRAELSAAGHGFRSDSDGEVIAHLYEAFGDAFVSRLEGQFAIALWDAAVGRLILARDRFGICPLHWAETEDAVYFCSEAKGFFHAGILAPDASPDALAQLFYFGTICAPATAFRGVNALQQAHSMDVTLTRTNSSRAYWTLDFPRIADQPRPHPDAAGRRVAELFAQAVASQTLGEFPATCLLSAGIDSAMVAAAAGREQPGLRAFCATSAQPRFDEGAQARATAETLGLQFHPVEVGDERIAEVFPRLIYHAESPVLSTEAAALLCVAERIRDHSKIVLTGEGADEAFAGYLAFRQYKAIGWLTRRGLGALRAWARPLLRRHYGNDCLLPGEPRLDAVRSRIGFVPAQAYEWEFYRTALLPVLSEEYAAQVDGDAPLQAFSLPTEATEGRHWLHRSLLVGQQVMLPNYLLGPHGDRVLAANSIEGRYPFLDRALFEYAATLPPELKIRRMREKAVLRAAAQRWLPESIRLRPKRRFMMPFGTPFLGPAAPEWVHDALAPDALREAGYFDPDAVARVLRALRTYRSGASGARAYLERLALGIAVTCVVSTQLWHRVFSELRACPDARLARAGMGGR